MTERFAQLLRHKSLVGGAALGLVLGVRLLEAAFGVVPGVRVASEMGIVISIALIALTLLPLLDEGPRFLWGLACVVLAIWGSGVLVPMWRLGHPLAVLHEGELGPSRDVATAPAPHRGRYLVEVDAQSPGTHGLYTVSIAAGGSTSVLSGPLNEARSLEVHAESGQSLHLFVQHADQPLLIRVRPVPLPWNWVELLALVVALFAVVVDALGFRAHPRLRGAFASVVAASACFVALLNPDLHPNARAIVGATILSAMAAALFGLLAMIVRLLVGRRSRK